MSIIQLWQDSKTMDYGAALTALSESDLAIKGDVIAAIKAQVATVLEEKRVAVANRDELKAVIAAIGDASGAAGESEVERAKDAAAKIKALNDALAASAKQVDTLTTEKATLEAAQSALLTKTTLQDVAAKTGANPSVLAKLITDTSAVKIDGDKVTIGDKEWADWIKSDDVAPFAPALIPATKNSPQLPTVSSAKASDSATEPASLYDRIRPASPKIGA
jgi:hypothetical protein